jgi:hypothetical protein
MKSHSGQHLLSEINRILAGHIQDSDKEELSQVFKNLRSYGLDAILGKMVVRAGAVGREG